MSGIGVAGSVFFLLLTNPEKSEDDEEKVPKTPVTGNDIQKVEPMSPGIELDVLSENQTLKPNSLNPDNLSIKSVEKRPVIILSLNK